MEAFGFCRLSSRAVPLLAVSFFCAANCASTPPVLATEPATSLPAVNQNSARLPQEVGQMHLDKGNAADAQSWFEKSLATASQAPSANQQQLAGTHESLAEAMLMQGDAEPAEQELRKALALRGTDSSSPPAAADYCLNKLATVYARLGRTDEALESYEKSLTGLRKHAGDSEAKAAAFSAAADCFYEHKRFREAGELYRESLTVRRKVLKPNNPKIAENARDCARCLSQQMLYEEALPLYEEALRVIQGNSGKEPSVRAKRAIAEARIDLGDCYARLKKFDAAESSYQAAADIESKLSNIADSEKEVLQEKREELNRLSGRSAGILFGQALANPLFWLGVFGVPMFALGVIAGIIMLIRQSTRRY